MACSRALHYLNRRSALLDAADLTGDSFAPTTDVSSPVTPVEPAGSPTSTERHHNRLSADVPGVMRNRALLSHLLRDPERAQRLSHVAAGAVATPGAVGALAPMPPSNRRKAPR
jgi:hypothetical protein